MIMLLPLCTSAYTSEDSLFSSINAAITQSEIDSIIANPPPQDAVAGWIAFYKEARIKNAPQHESYGKIMVAFYRRLQSSPLWCGGTSYPLDEVAEMLGMQLEAIASEWAEQKFITLTN